MYSLDENRWRALAARLRLAYPDKVLTALQRHYAQPHRHYHTAEHIHDCLARLDEAEHPSAREPLVEYALWFHDAIYRTFSGNNEQRSAAWAGTVLRDSGAAPEPIALTESLILATRHQHLPTEPPHQLVVDIDLSILGAAPDRFARYERQIRAEYRWFSRRLYRRKRRAVLEIFLTRPAIYSTDEFRSRFEEQARENLNRAVARLSG